MDFSTFMQTNLFNQLLMKQSLLVLFIVVGLQSPFFSINAQKITPALIDSLVMASIEMMPQAGVAVAVIENGKIVYAKGYGVASAKTKKKVDANTLFAIASNSKSFTGAALAILVEEGKLDWNDKVVDHLPEFKMYDPYVTANFNIIDLLTHRSGLDLGAGDLMFFPDGADFTALDVMKSFQYQEPTSAFRTKFDYDNLLYIVAGELIARKSGVSWPEFVESRIMNPIGMSSSVGNFQRLESKENLAEPHAIDDGELKVIDHMVDMDPSAAAAGGIYSSVNDMSQWLLLQLNQGKYGQDLSKQIFNEQSQSTMWQPYTSMSFNPRPQGNVKSHFSSYGLGWFIQDKNGYVTLEHTGGLPGMLSSTLLIPELNAGAVVLTNSDPGGYNFWTLRASITDALIGAEPTDWISMMKSQIENRETKGDSIVDAVWDIALKNKPGEIDVDNYLGTYRDNWFGDIKIEMKGDKLWFTSLRSPKLNGQMFYYQANTFAIKWEYQDMPCDAFAMFELDEKGEAVAIKMKGISPNIDFSFDFQHLDLKRVTD